MGTSHDELCASAAHSPTRARVHQPEPGSCACRGHRAALAGGTTFHIDFALPEAGTGDLIRGLEGYHQRASKGLMDYGFHMAITQWSDKARPQLLSSFREPGL